MLKAFGSLYDSNKPTSIDINSYRVSSSNTYNPAIYNTFNAAFPASVSNKFYYVLDLEALNSHSNIILNGIDTSNSHSTFVRFDIKTALASQITTIGQNYNVNYNIYMYSCHNVILTFNLNAGTISSSY